jgi:hypothetical protein
LSYFVCEECGKYYTLNEGKDSFSYQKCTCGGKLSYTDTLNGINNNRTPLTESKIKCADCGTDNNIGSANCFNCGKELSQQPLKTSHLNEGISYVGIAIGFGFLVTSSLFAVIAIFGTNVPQRVDEIPYNLLISFGIIAMFFAIVSGVIASYIGGSIKFKTGIINGGLVGIILGVLVGATSGSVTFLGVLAIFGSLSGFGGILGTLLKRRF